MRANCVTLALVIVVGAMVGANRVGYPDNVHPLTGKGNWFQDYMDQKDKMDLEAEGKALDIAVDDEGMV
jgi:hypothetical protein